MRVLALAALKGGSGKTTLAGHFAVQAQRSGAGPVALIDLDPLGSLADWWNGREDELPAFAQTTVVHLAADLEALHEQGFKLAIIDTPPALTAMVQSAIAASGLVVVPVLASPHDLNAAGATAELCERAGKPALFVLNAAVADAPITADVAAALAQHGAVAPVTVHHSADFAAAMVGGGTVLEDDAHGRPAAEVVTLWNYVADQLEKTFRRAVFSAPASTSSLPGTSRPAGGFGRRVVGS